MNKFYLTLASFLFITSFINAQDADKEKVKEKSKWTHSTAAGLTITSGNSETIVANGNHKSELKREKDLFQFSLFGNYGVKETTNDDNEKSDEEFLVNAAYKLQYDRNINKRLFWLVGQSSELDKIANLEYRINIGPGLGYKMFKKEKLTLDFELGGNYILEKYEDIDEENIVAARAAEKFNWKITDTSNLWLNTEVLINVEDEEDVRVNAELGIGVKINDSWHIKSVVQDKFVNVVPEGTDRNDITFITTLVFKY